MASPGGMFSLSDVSCASADFCTAVGQIGPNATARTLIEMWDGARWSVARSPDGGTGGLDGVSCPSPTYCAAVGSAGASKALVEMWDGKRWSVIPNPTQGNGAAALTQVSCSGPVFCAAIGFTGLQSASYRPLIEMWDGTGWSIIPGPSSAHANDVSCVSPVFCVAVGYSGPETASQSLIETWDGARWSDTPGPTLGSGSSEFSGVSCQSPPFCIAIGHNLTTHKTQALTATWSGKRWSIVASTTFGYPDAVSCTSPASCVAVGASQAPEEPLLETWNGTRWSITPSIVPANGGGLTRVSCPSPSFCAAVGHTPAGTLAEIGRPVSPPGPPGAPSTCHAAADVSLESEIDKASATKIKIPGKAIDFPAGLSGNATVAFVPGDVTICRNDLKPSLNTRHGFDNGQMSISADGYGPFVYDSAVAAWTQTPGAPHGQRFATDFSGAQIKTDVSPSLSASFGSDPGIGITIATLTVSARRQVITLVSAGASLLQAGLGPELDFSVSIDKSAAESAVQDEEAQGVTLDQAVADIADVEAGDASVAITGAASEFYGISVSISQEQALFGPLQVQITSGLAADALLTDGFTPAQGDAVAGDTTASQAAQVDAELGTDAVEVSGLDDLVNLFLL